MGRPRRVSTGGLVYHALNLVSGRKQIFQFSGDYLAFQQILNRCQKQIQHASARLLHHAKPQAPDALTQEGPRPVQVHRMDKLDPHPEPACPTPDNRRWPPLSGSYKSYVVESDALLLQVCHYFERNAVWANLVDHAKNWRWVSLWLRTNRAPGLSSCLDESPVNIPGNWIEYVNQPQTSKELQAARDCIKRGRPFGSPGWLLDTVDRHDLHSTLRSRGRPP